MGSLLSIIGGAFTLIKSLLGWKHDKEVVRAAANKGSRKALEAQLDAERVAGAEKRKRDGAATEGQSRLQEKVDDALESGGSPADAVWDGMFTDNPEGKN